MIRSRRRFFDNHFANPVRTVRLMNQGEFGAPAVAAFAADLVGLLPDRLTIYRYSDQANSYRLAEDVVHSIDERGYLRLILPAGGCYVIARPCAQAAPKDASFSQLHKLLVGGLLP